MISLVPSVLEYGALIEPGQVWQSSQNKFIRRYNVYDRSLGKLSPEIGRILIVSRNIRLTHAHKKCSSQTDWIGHLMHILCLQHQLEMKSRHS